jgi:hypothetical protein
LGSEVLVFDRSRVDRCLLKGWLVVLYSRVIRVCDFRLFLPPGGSDVRAGRCLYRRKGLVEDEVVIYVCAVHALPNYFALSPCRRVSHARGFHGLSSRAWFPTPNSCCSDVRSGRRLYLRKGLDEDEVVIYVRTSHAFANLDPLSPMQAPSINA